MAGFTCSFCGGPVTSGMSTDMEGTIAICEKCLLSGIDNMIDGMKKDGMTSADIFSIIQDIRYAEEGLDVKVDLKQDDTQKYVALKPAEIKALLDDYVVNQDKAKRVLAVAAYNHYKRLGSVGENKHDVDLEKSNVLLLGPTGTGKTLLVKTLSRILDVPMVIADATSLTENGYVGDDVESVVEKLYLASGKNVKRAEKGIIYIDEIDKIAADFESSRKDVGGAGVQQALLKIIEGHKIHFIPSAEKKNPMMAQTIEIDTTNILFIVGGAFANIDYADVTHDAIREYGIIPELLGRLPVVTQTEELNMEAMLRILTEPKNSIIRQYQALFDIENVSLSFTDAALEAIAKEGMATKTGARGLRGVVEKIMLDLAYEAPSIENLTHTIVDFKDGKITRKFIKAKLEVAG